MKKLMEKWKFIKLIWRGLRFCMIAMLIIAISIISIAIIIPLLLAIPLGLTDLVRTYIWLPFAPETWQSSKIIAYFIILYMIIGSIIVTNISRGKYNTKQKEVKQISKYKRWCIGRAILSTYFVTLIFLSVSLPLYLNNIYIWFPLIVFELSIDEFSVGLFVTISSLIIIKIFCPRLIEKRIEKYSNWLAEKNFFITIIAILTFLGIILSLYLIGVSDFDLQFISDKALKEKILLIRNDSLFKKPIVLCTALAIGILLKLSDEMQIPKKMGEYKSWIFNKLFYYWVIGIIAFLLISITFYWIIFNDWLGLFGAVGNPEEATQFYRNRGFSLVAIVGVGLTIWGRWLTQKQNKLGKKSNADERYEKAANMLGNNVLAVRVAGCHALRNLATFDAKEKSTAIRCLNLLFAYINTPHVTKNGNKAFKDFDEKLREDIQAAVDAFSDINKYYYDKKEKLDLMTVDLPNHFWKNSKKEIIYLQGIWIETKELKNAYLRYANLSEVYLIEANLSEANLIEANLSYATLNYTKLMSAFLNNTNLLGANLVEVDLSEAILRESHMFATDLSNANLSKANLIRANLSFANLSNANLKEAYLYWIDIENANLSEADLSMTELYGADMRSTNLSKADLSGTKLANAKYLEKEQILSATWGYTRKEECGKEEPTPPILPEKLLKDKEIQKWLEKPHHNKFEEEREREREREELKASLKKAKAKAKIKAAKKKAKSKAVKKTRGKKPR